MLAGVDGYKHGWIAAILNDHGSTEVKAFRTFRSLQDDKSLRLIVIDIPIGLPDIGARGPTDLSNNLPLAQGDFRFT
jgi:predicted RNase H-like nuclease